MKAYQVLKRFQRKYQLTDREFEVVLLLVKGYSSLKDLANELNLSTSTINNHLDNVYRKTNTGSKGRVLSAIISDLAEDLSQLEWQLGQEPGVTSMPVVNRPGERVWLLMPDQDERQMFQGWMSDIGYQVIPIDTLESLESKVNEISIVPTVTVIDSAYGNTKVLNMVRVVRQKFGERHPIVVISHEQRQGQLLVDSIRAIGAIPKPCDLDLLRDTLGVAVGQGQKRLESRVPMELSVKLFWEDTQVEMSGKSKNISMNGFAMQTSEPLKPGEAVTFDLILSRGKLLSGKGSVVWSKEASFKFLSGIKIVEMSQSDRTVFEQFVSARDLAKTGTDS